MSNIQFTVYSNQLNGSLVAQNRPPPPRRIEQSHESTSARAQEREADGKQHGNHSLTQDEQREVEQLKRRDREVRAHEAAHLAAAGRHARGGASYEYERGPDGRQYAVGGEVQIDTSKPDDPQQALQKAQQIRAAALAPAQPSSQDRAVAAQAAVMASEARAELAQEHKSERSEATAQPDEQERGRAQAYAEIATERSPVAGGQLDVRV